MKIKIILSVLAVMAVLSAQPKLFIEQKTFDFGTVSEGEKVPHSFSIANKGNEPLKITAVRTSCGCTAAKYDSLIAPGKTGSISAEFNSSGFSGQQEKIITVHSNDADSATIRLQIKGFVKTPLDINPRWINLNSDNGKVKGSVSLSALQTDFAIKKAQFFSNNNSENIAPITVNTTLKNKGKPDKNGVVVYEFDFNFSINTDKNESGRIVFETNVKQKPSIDLNVSIENKKDVVY